MAGKTEKAEEKTFWVVAIPHNAAQSEGDVVGYFNHKRVRVGQRFQVTDKDFSKKWMQRVDSKKAKESDEEARDVKASKGNRHDEDESPI